MSILWWRLPKKAIDQLTLPKLPEGYYFVMCKNSWTSVRRHRAVWPFFAHVGTEFAIFGTENLVARYNYALEKLSHAAKADAKKRYAKNGFMKGIANERTY